MSTFEPIPAENEKERKDKDAVDEAFKRLPDWVRTGNMVKGLKLEPGAQCSVNHGLKRRPQGWLVMSLRSYDGGPNLDAIIVEANRDAGKLVLANTGTTSVAVFDVWVF